MKKHLLPLVIVAMLSGCASNQSASDIIIKGITAGVISVITFGIVKSQFNLP